MLNTFVFSSRHLFKTPTHTHTNKQIPEVATGSKPRMDQKKTACVDIQFKVVERRESSAFKSLDESQFFHVQNKGAGLRLYLAQSNDRPEHTDTRTLSHFPFFPQESTPGRQYHQTEQTDG